MLKRIGLLLVGSVIGCGAPATQSTADYNAQSESIINGQSCGSGESPEAVAILPQLHLRAGSQRFSQNTVACTGTLIAPDVVMAAGHCVDLDLYRQELSGSGYTLESVEFYISYQANLTSLSSGYSNSLPSDAVRVVRTEAHPDYTLEGFGTGPQKLNDISVLFLEEAQSVQPAIVITSAERNQVVRNADVDIVGWGQQTAASTPSPGTVGAKRCATSFINQLGATEMQIGGDTSTSRKCHGDSGGPTFMNVDTSFSNKRRVIGITSHAYDQSDCQKGGVDTRVDAYLDWLDETLTAACQDNTRVWCDVEGIIPPEFYETDHPTTGGDGGSGDNGGDDGSGGDNGGGSVDNGGGSDTDGSARARRGSCATGDASMLSLLALTGLALLRRRSLGA